jgi:exonuclease III
MRIATWNLKQAVAPKKPLAELWTWAEQRIDPSVIVFTEAKVPKTGVPAGWNAVWDPDGVEHVRNTWGTVVAGRGVELERVTSVRSGIRRRHLDYTWRGAVEVVDVYEVGAPWGTVIGLYAVTRDRHGNKNGNGSFSVPRLLQDLEPLIRDRRRTRLVLAGDFNLWPINVKGMAEAYGLTDLVAATASTRPALKGCSGCTLGRECGHMWTHRNGNGPNAAVQNIDYIYGNEIALSEVLEVTGGIRDFPDAWDMSDHAPVVAEFRI